MGSFLNRARNKRKTTKSVIIDGIEIQPQESLQFDWVTIRNATNNFSDLNKIGEGGFGSVYKGRLPDGQEIAVKRHSQYSDRGSQEFMNEVLFLHKVQHRNFVRFLGFCLEGHEKLIIYEFAPNGSLDKYLFDSTKNSYLDWEKRFKIIGGIARGLLYLHEDSPLRIIHRNIKPQNILLDGEMNAKITDLGLAKLLEIDQTQGEASSVVGTLGYIAPECVFQGLISVKSDVFSFGVSLLQIISGRKLASFHDSTQLNFLSYAWKHWREGTALELMDPTLMDSFSRDEVMRSIHIGLLCVQEKVEERPTMFFVVVMLSNYSLTLAPPSKPAFYPDSIIISDRELDQSNSISGSDIDISETELDQSNSISGSNMVTRETMLDQYNSSSTLYSVMSTGSPPPLIDVQPTRSTDSPPSPHSVIIVPPTIIGAILHFLKKKTRRKTDGNEIRIRESMQFDLVTIRKATNNFSISNKIGVGRSGGVYKGQLSDGQEIAVKRVLGNSEPGLQYFKNELMVMLRLTLQHRNLVRVLGFCLEGEEKILIHEYVPNNSLRDYLFDNNKRSYLNWEKRYKIIGDIAQGLVYLHEGSRLKIIHRNLKAGNILLDDDLNAKITDLGIAKLFVHHQRQGKTSRIDGTLGYMAPEYLRDGLFSVKSDVFSFGVLVLEIVSGQNITSFHHSLPQQNLLSYAWKHWREGTALEVMDTTLIDNFSRIEVMRSIHIGLLCVQEKMDDRPNISSVVEMLNSYSLTLASPSQPSSY